MSPEPEVRRGPYVKDDGRPIPAWDGERHDGRPVARCGECGTLHFIEDIEYIGEAALGGPNFSYQLGKPVREDTE
jgi:hypothetical protein